MKNNHELARAAGTLGKTQRKSNPQRSDAVLLALLRLTREIAVARAELRAPLKTQPTEGSQT